MAGGSAAVAVVLLVGVPTAVVPTPWFTRMTAVSWWAYPMLLGAAGLIAALTARRSRRAGAPGAGRSLGGVTTALAVGCPVCNKLVVATAGAPAAMAIWAPLQPALGLAGLLGLGYLLARARRSGQSPPTPAATGRAVPACPTAADPSVWTAWAGEGPPGPAGVHDDAAAATRA